MKTKKIFLGTYLILIFTGCGSGSDAVNSSSFNEFKAQFSPIAPLSEIDLYHGKQMDSLASLPFLTKIFPPAPIEDEHSVEYLGIGRLDNPNGITSVILYADYVGPMSETEFQLITFDTVGAILDQSVIAIIHTCNNELKGNFSDLSCLTITREDEIGCMEDGFKTYIVTDTTYFGIGPEGKIEELDAPCLK